MEKQGMVFLDTQELERRSLLILKTVGNLRLIGESGCGKTRFVRWLVQKHGWRLYETVLNSDTSRWDLLASDILQGGETTQRDGIVLQWLKDNYGGIKVLYLDGYNYAPSNVMSLMESLADFRMDVWIPELNKTFKRTADHYLIIAMNPWDKEGYSGTFRSNIAQVRRFETLVVDYLNVNDEARLLKKLYPKVSTKICIKLAAFAKKTRDLYIKGQLSIPITTGNLMNYCQMLSGDGGPATEADIADIASNMFLETERATVRNLFEESNAPEV